MLASLQYSEGKRRASYIQALGLADQLFPRALFALRQQFVDPQEVVEKEVGGEQLVPLDDAAPQQLHEAREKKKKREEKRREENKRDQRDDEKERKKKKMGQFTTWWRGVTTCEEAGVQRGQSGKRQAQEDGELSPICSELESDRQL